MNRLRFRVLGSGLAGLVVLSGCAKPPPPPPSCEGITATARTDRIFPVGAVDAPTVGPLGFHVYDYSSGAPTKTIISVVSGQPEEITLRGSRCGDGATLRFWFAGGVPIGSGDEVATLPPAAAGLGHIGYMLFSGKGRWRVAVSQGGTELGALQVEVV